MFETIYVAPSITRWSLCDIVNVLLDSYDFYCISTTGFGVAGLHVKDRNLKSFLWVNPQSSLK